MSVYSSVMSVVLEAAWLLESCTVRPQVKLNKFRGIQVTVSVLAVQARREIRHVLGRPPIIAFQILSVPSMASSCQNLLAALKDCLMQSDCVMKQGNLPSDCLRNHADELPEECQSLRKATFECKRGMVCFKSDYRHKFC